MKLKLCSMVQLVLNIALLVAVFLLAVRSVSGQTGLGNQPSPNRTSTQTCQAACYPQGTSCVSDGQCCDTMVCLGYNKQCGEQGSAGASCSQPNDCDDDNSCVIPIGATVGICQPKICDCAGNKCVDGYVCVAVSIMGTITSCQPGGNGGTDICVCQNDPCSSVACANYCANGCDPSNPICTPPDDDACDDDPCSDSSCPDYCTACDPDDPICTSGGRGCDPDDTNSCDIDSCEYINGCDPGDGGTDGCGECNAIPVRGGIPIPDADPNMLPSRAVQRSPDQAHPMSYVSAVPLVRRQARSLAVGSSERF
jgi:hypothetical protein